ncbi:MAPEG family protein, partial [Klebsiella pneumoniae]|uniref:MAPEG family protein n=1 Tax=Klebsiella pneumoniae TaxID=573 RepID=UPI0028F3F8AD
QTPLWLAQHPHIMAFHQAPKEYGGDAALLILIEVEEWQPPELQVAIRVHGNAVEYVPIGLILLLFMEMNGAQTWMVHVCGIL